MPPPAFLWPVITTMDRAKHPGGSGVGQGGHHARGPAKKSFSKNPLGLKIGGILKVVPHTQKKLLLVTPPQLFPLNNSFADGNS